MHPNAKRIFVPFLKDYPNVPSQLEAIRPLAASRGVELIEFGVSRRHFLQAGGQAFAGVMLGSALVRRALGQSATAPAQSPAGKAKAVILACGRVGNFIDGQIVGVTIACLALYISLWASYHCVCLSWIQPGPSR